jgi:hypothetical protein
MCFYKGVDMTKTHVKFFVFFGFLLCSNFLHSSTLPNPYLPFVATDFGAPCTLITDIQEHTCDTEVKSSKKMKVGFGPLQYKIYFGDKNEH